MTTETGFTNLFVLNTLSEAKCKVNGTIQKKTKQKGQRETETGHSTRIVHTDASAVSFGLTRNNNIKNNYYYKNKNSDCGSKREKEKKKKKNSHAHACHVTLADQ